MGAARLLRAAHRRALRHVCVLLGLVCLWHSFPATAQEDNQALYGDRCPVPIAARELPSADSELQKAHHFATGKGVRVAVIDTGVAAHPRLGGVIDGGDYLGAEPGGAFRDCDGHGTIVAGIIAARPDPQHDDLRGVAPGAHIISIRQSSAILQAAPPTDEYGNPIPQEDSETAHSAGNLQTLTLAIHNALDLEADIISLSVVSCIPADIAANLDSQPLRAALGRAEQAGAVVVAAAGNKGGSCDEHSVVFPANFDTVVAVSAIQTQGTIAEYSMPSTKPLLSAPGHTPVGLSPSGEGWAEALTHPGTATTQGFEGTSFATPVVSGVVALLKERYPHLTPSQIRDFLNDSVDPATGAINPLQVITHLQGTPPIFHHTAVPVPPPPSGVSERFHKASIMSASLSVAVAVLITVIRRRSTGKNHTGKTCSRTICSRTN